MTCTCTNTYTNQIELSNEKVVKGTSIFVGSCSGVSSRSRRASFINGMPGILGSGQVIPLIIKA